MKSGVLLGCVLAACSAGAGDAVKLPAPGHDEFLAQWYRGQAELTRYELSQWRYGESHRGDALLIFVTEDFLPDEQVKHEHGTPSIPPRSVLKLNATKRFDTGIYTYSILTSVFTPVAGDRRTLKVSSSVQEWCGHTYAQLNLRDGGYRGLSHSYFQDEADRELDLAPALLEDELWTRIRIDPSALPEGEIELIPGLESARLAHRPTRVERAVATLSRADDGSIRYRIDYKGIPRSLEVRFEAAFPHAIVSWEERSGSAPGDRSQVTRATRTHTLMTDYWTKHSASDADWRRRLGLD